MRTSFRWLVALGLLGLVLPILFYLVTGFVISLMLPCSPEAGVPVLTVDGDAVTFGCGAVRHLVRLSVSLWGTTLVLGGAYLMALGDMLATE